MSPLISRKGRLTIHEHVVTCSGSDHLHKLVYSLPRDSPGSRAERVLWRQASLILSFFVVSQTDAVTFTGCLREPGSQAVKLLHITQSGSVPKAEGGRTELGKRADRAAALLEINSQENTHLTHRGFAFVDIAIEPHIHHNRCT